MDSHDPFAKDSTVTRTVRINEAYDTVLRYEAERRGVSVNTLVDQILRRYSVSYRFFENLSAVTMSVQTVSGLLDLIDMEDIRAAGKLVGRERPKELILKRGIPLSYEAVVWYITELLGDHSGWYRANYYERPKKDIIHLSHALGDKWSVFLSEYMEAFLEEVLEVTPEVESLRDSVTLTIDKTKIKQVK
ncbi:hypothetical protein JXL21_09030 [Candidatus Bathyarchaeota archaeon]|nr:hypothetical protein [Candidatus Bathyarchaeota archaeon]